MLWPFARLSKKPQAKRRRRILQFFKMKLPKLKKKYFKHKMLLH